MRLKKYLCAPQLLGTGLAFDSTGQISNSSNPGKPVPIRSRSGLVKKDCFRIDSGAPLGHQWGCQLANGVSHADQPGISSVDLS